MKRYNPKELEAKWQKQWEDSGIYHATEDPKKPKRYVLEYFPYPSGAAMHVGHVRNYTIGDALARFNRMNGFNVLHPMGWDAFGLPAENYAIKTGTSPRKAVDENTKKFKKQLMEMGFSYDWTREIDSTDPNYYKWTQWFFLLLHKRGLAYQKESLQWWCPVDKTVLANEQVENGRCWRCDSIVEKKPLKQWFFKITEYADRLVEDIEDLNWSDAIKTMQRNWIGRSVGAEIDFEIKDSKEKITVFTTRHDTQYGVTFLVLAPEHPLVKKINTKDQQKAVETYVKTAGSKSDIERQSAGDKEKTGVFTGAYAINPANNEEIPIWTADYVLTGYGTGAVMGVPAHDDRDHVFAKKYDLEIRQVLKTDHDSDFHSEGVVINSDKYNDMRSEAMREEILKDFIKQGVATERVNYKIRDWLISRQRYWGAPIPIIHCPKDGAVPVPEKDLPVVLPELKKFEPTDDGRSPLANVPEFVNTTCPQCGGKAERETDTMDGFACSSWYFLRFADPHNNKEAFSKKQAEFWLPVDDYIGGAEHAVMHLLYARFWTKVMYDEGLINFTEPFTTLRNQGMILAPDGLKMSKSKGNTIEPGGLIDQGYGADSIRIMELFIGPYNQMANWSVEGMGGSFRFLQRVWTLTHEFIDAEQKGSKENHQLLVATHQAIKKVSQDLHELGFNTAIAALMEYTNELYKIKAKDNFAAKDWQFAIDTLLQLLAPFAPHITEELWHDLGKKDSIHVSMWPTHDDTYLVNDTVTIVVQVNGKVRANIQVNAGSEQEVVEKAALADENVKKFVTDAPKKTIFVKDKLVSFVV
jgi:leucyl-tRNA synthetase